MSQTLKVMKRIIWICLFILSTTMSHAQIKKIYCTATKGNCENISIFPVNNPLNTSVAKDATEPSSKQIIALMGAMQVRADFGTAYGIPYTVVCGDQPKVMVKFTDYPEESDKGPYAIPLDAQIEGNGTGDAHVISVDMENGLLYELFNAHIDNGSWTASCGAIFDLNTNKLRPDDWVSADAAGLPIFSCLVRYDEILKGKIDHAIRCILPLANLNRSHVSPARHSTNGSGGQYSLPLGARLRLRADFNISGFSTTNQVILNAMKTYGLIVADGGMGLSISGAQDSRWNDDDLMNLKKLNAGDFEVVKMPVIKMIIK